MDINDDKSLDEELLDLFQQQQEQEPSTSNSGRRSSSSGGAFGSASAAAKKRKGGGKKRRGNRSDSDEDDSEYESEDDVDDDSLNDDDDEEEEDSDFEARHELLREVDEQELEGLTELEREALLAEREEKRQQLLEKLEIKRRLKQSTAGAKRNNRKQRQTQSKSQKQKKLQELKAKRSGKKSKLDYDDKDVDFGLSDEEDEDYVKRIRSSYTSDKKGSEKESPITLEELNSIMITRHQLEKWAYAPFFRDTVVGLFVRIIIGVDERKVRRYRVAEVVDIVDYHRVYKLNQTPTNQALRVRHGKAEKTFLMDVTSNDLFTDDEYRRWIRVMEAEKQRILSRTQLKMRKKKLEEAISHVFTSEEVDEMVSKKRKVDPTITNVSLEKMKLQTQKEAAEHEGNHELAKRLEARIAELDSQIRQGSHDVKKADIWAKLNARNRMKNLEDISKAEQLVRKERIERLVQSSRKKKDGDNNATKFDPFARIKAKPTQITTNALGQPEHDSGESTPRTPLTPSEERRKSLGSGVPGTPNDHENGDAFDQFADADIDVDI